MSGDLRFMDGPTARAELRRLRASHAAVLEQARWPLWRIAAERARLTWRRWGAR